jgi:hypothetical protein
MKKFFIPLIASFIMALVATLSAEVTTNTVVPFNSIITNPCLGEQVQLTGDLHVVLGMEDTGNGMLMTAHFQPQGITGLGLTTGATYHATGVTRSTVFVTGTPPFDFTSVNNYRIIGTGDAANFMVHSNIHMTVDANGDVTAEVDNTQITCH